MNIVQQNTSKNISGSEFVAFVICLCDSQGLRLQSVGSPDLIGGPRTHRILLHPGGVGFIAGGEAVMAFRDLIRHHLGHQVSDRAAHVGGAGKRGGGHSVGAAGG